MCSRGATPADHTKSNDVLSALDRNILLNALKFEGINGKSVEAFTVLDIANESNAALIANTLFH